MTRIAAGLYGIALLAAAVTSGEQRVSDPLPASAQNVPLAPASSPHSETSATGVVDGRVIYKADPRRPWRYARYYVKDSSRGYLGEAVVALSGPGLKREPTEPSLVRMDQKDFRFVPETVAVRVGDSVQFTNSDPQLHNVRAEEGAQTFNVNTPVGGDYTHTFDAAGGTRRPVRIGCVFHSQMQAWIFVFAHPYFQVTAEDGKFHLADVPAGEYELEVVHPAGNLRWSQRVTVRANEVTAVDILISPDNVAEPKP